MRKIGTPVILPSERYTKKSLHNYVRHNKKIFDRLAIIEPIALAQQWHDFGEPHPTPPYWNEMVRLHRQATLSAIKFLVEKRRCAK